MTDSAEDGAYREGAEETTPAGRYLTDADILAACHELLAAEGPNATIRSLQEVLRRRYQRAGKTTRISKIWREVSEAPVPVEVEALVVSRAREQVRDAERIAREALNAAEAAVARAEISEERERGHQDYWAMQIDDLRQRLTVALADCVRVPELERRILELHRELARSRAEVAQIKELAAAAGIKVGAPVQIEPVYPKEVSLDGFFVQAPEGSSNSTVPYISDDEGEDDSETKQELEPDADYEQAVALLDARLIALPAGLAAHERSQESQAVGEGGAQQVAG